MVYHNVKAIERVEQALRVSHAYRSVGCRIIRRSNTKLFNGWGTCLPGCGKLQPVQGTILIRRDKPPLAIQGHCDPRTLIVRRRTIKMFYPKIRWILKLANFFIGWLLSNLIIATSKGREKCSGYTGP